MNKVPLIEMQGITKNFPGVTALDNVDFDLKAGEIHALVGENGAGKSTLMRILFGVHQPDAGKILVKGQEVSIPDPSYAQKLGISMVHQELLLVPDMNVAQNIALGRETNFGSGFLNWRSIFKDAKENLARVGVELDLKTPVGQLSVAQQQMIEIAKALSWNADVLVMDEPTSCLTPHEVDQLFVLLKNLAGQGVGIIFITHRLEEIFEIADRVTVYRDGCRINSWPIKDVSMDKIINAMVDRKIDDMHRKKISNSKKEILRVEGLCTHELDRISFSAYTGEILGIAGLVGAGRSELARAVFGADPIKKGTVFVNGTPVLIKSPKDAVLNGIGFLPEDRKVQGLVLSSSMESNMALCMYDRLSKFTVVKRKERRNLTRHYIDSLKITPPYPERLVRFLSGGNQQKVVIGKWLARNVEIIIFDEPTRGIDVGAKAEVHQLMIDLVEAGTCVIMISSELHEILHVSDRILVMREGRIVADLENQKAKQKLIMEYATGFKKQTEAL
ncbi:MAG: sugar ABC transporter ATP-binding protein [Pelolinea sp.]|nr:sugar ABC transporter ATP-binding protein [Pelolinea sp.]